MTAPTRPSPCSIALDEQFWQVGTNTPDNTANWSGLEYTYWSVEGRGKKGGEVEGMKGEEECGERDIERKGGRGPEGGREGRVREGGREGEREGEREGGEMSNI